VTIFVMFVAAIVAFVAAAILTPLMARWAHRRNLLDIPNERSSHVIATPRIGGVALVTSVLVALALLQIAGAGISHDAGIVLTGALGIAAIGLVDDVWTLSAIVRLVVQATVAATVVALVGSLPFGLFPPDSWGAMVLSVFWIGLLTNAYNFMDGIDGIAGTQALVAGVGWTIVAFLAGAHDVAALSLLLAAASSGFLLHNWQPAKVFMGDAGSGFFGFLFAALPLLAPKGRVSFLWCGALLMWPFVFDTGFTLVRRASRFENILSAHRSHLYQRLVLTGCSHRDVTLVYAALALLGVVSAILVETRQPMALFSILTIGIAAGALWWSLTSREALREQRSDPA
jgi:UDP-N-acetylmuramyl pentapeptide phosphotransferase/UDP-N-acetylglucosamine-1-phosphate transferase